MSVQDIPNASLKTNTMEEISNNEWLQGLRHSLQYGIRHKNCKACWEEEDAGMTSKRQRDTDFDAPLPDTTVSILDLKLGNLCNLKCRICNPYNSSKWFQEWADVRVDSSSLSHFTENIKSIKTLWDDDSKIWDNLEAAMPNVTHMELYGGEPFLIKRLWELLAFTKQAGNSKNISIHFNTNGSVSLTDEQWSILQEFKAVDFQVSLDDVGARHTYQRHPSDWNVVRENVLKFKSVPWLKMNTNITISMYNLYYIDESSQQIFDEFGTDVYFNQLHRPDTLSITHLSPEIKSILVDKMKNARAFKRDIDNTLNRVATDPNPELVKKFLQETEIHDKYRNESFSATFPEWYELLMKHYG
jgi:sulfatase maturation enzyme AslB (radical SAM superfamily)